MIYVVTRNASCYDDHDFSTMAVEVDMPLALRRVADVMFDDYAITLEYYLPSQRLLLEKRKVTDLWAHENGYMVEYLIEAWQPGDAKPEKTWKVCFDGSFKRQIIENEWSDDDVRREWQNDHQLVTNALRPLDSPERMPTLSPEEQDAWRARHGAQREKTG